MRLTRCHRPFRVITVVFSLWVLLFAQGVLAGYVCKGLANQAQPARMTQMAQMAEGGMPCAESMALADEQQAGLCHAHCQTSQQSADNHQVPALASLEQFAPGLSVEPVQPSYEGAGLQRPLLRRWSAPPLAVLHCCFRI